MPSGGKRLASRNGSAFHACGLKAGLRTALFNVSGAVRFEQSLRVVAQVVTPVDPGVTAAADVQFMFDPALFQNLRKVFRAIEGERVFFSDANRKQLDLFVGLVGIVEQGGR